MKVITPDNYLIRPFRVNKTWLINYRHLTAVNSSSVRIDVATAPTASWNTWTTAGAQNTDGIYTELLYPSVQHTFYTGSVSEGDRYIPLGNRVKLYYPTGSQFYVVNVNQQSFGEGIRPGTFVLSSGASTASIYDDSQGRLISSTNTGSVVGNIFYQSGVAVLQKDTGSYSGSLVTDKGLFLSASSNVSIQYASIHTIYEHQVICTLDPNEMNFSTNPTMRWNTLTGSVYSGKPAVELVFSGTLEPYWTSVGLYNDVGEMVAIAKVPKPIRRAINTQQTIIVRFDA